MISLIKDILSLSKSIRYVALYTNGELITEIAPSVQNTSSSETDKFEELLVNPAILLLTKQRGDIDCGGCKFVLVRYGNFYQFVRPINKGHLSVAIEVGSDTMDIIEKIEQIISHKTKN